MINIALLGSTGSIGTQVLQVVKRHSDKFRIAAMVSNKNSRAFLSQIKEFRPDYAGLSDQASGAEIKDEARKVCSFEYGNEVLERAASFNGVDLVFIAVSGFIGIKAVICAIKNRKRVAIANKEVLVSGGEIVTSLAKEYGVELVPVDSEHSAIFQALSFDKTKEFKKLIITASGGPFLNTDKAELKNVTVERALKHPNWNMGGKITIDSATLMNKGLEVIEAMRLYNCGLDKIEVVVHPESIIHSMVEYADNSVIAQMSYPTMEIPIQLALTYPERIDTAVAPLDFKKIGKLTFFDVDKDKFPCFQIAIDSVKAGGIMPCIMNAANEEAVGLFLKKKINYTSISELIYEVMNKIEFRVADKLETLIEADKRAREEIFKEYAKRSEHILY